MKSRGLRLGHVWNHEICSKQVQFALMSVNYSIMSDGLIGIFFRFSFI